MKIFFLIKLLNAFNVHATIDNFFKVNIAIGIFCNLRFKGHFFLIFFNFLRWFCSVEFLDAYMFLRCLLIEPICLIFMVIAFRSSRCCSIILRLKLCFIFTRLRYINLFMNYWLGQIHNVFDVRYRLWLLKLWLFRILMLCLNIFMDFTFFLVILWHVWYLRIWIICRVEAQMKDDWINFERHIELF